jgi:hypothetical protein
VILFAIAALLAAPQYSDDQMKRDAEILVSVSSETMTLPVLQCARSNIRAHAPSDAEMGDLKKAAELAGASFAACGFKAQSEKLEQAVQSKYPQLPTGESKRLSEVAFGIPFAVALYDAAELLKATPPAPPSTVVEIPLPCPPDLKHTPGHPCFEKPKK